MAIYSYCNYCTVLFACLVRIGIGHEVFSACREDRGNELAARKKQTRCMAAAKANIPISRLYFIHSATQLPEFGVPGSDDSFS